MGGGLGREQSLLALQFKFSVFDIRLNGRDAGLGRVYRGFSLRYSGFRILNRDVLNAFGCLIVFELRLRTGQGCFGFGESSGIVLVFELDQ